MENNIPTNSPVLLLVDFVLERGSPDVRLLAPATLLYSD